MSLKLLLTSATIPMSRKTQLQAVQKVNSNNKKSTATTDDKIEKHFKCHFASQ